MPKNLRWKWIVINAIVLGCVLGITGVPKSKRELMASLTQRIRLGLDLKGGSHMVLQVQVQDAFKRDADQVIEQLKPILVRQNVAYGFIDRSDPQSIETADTIEIDISGVPSNSSGVLTRVISEAVGDKWMLAPVSATAYKLTLRREAASALRQETLARTIDTIEKKVNGLGVAEASVQRRGGSDGEAEILVQLPGVDDPARVKGILQTTAMLELCEVKGGPYESRAALLASHGGVLPLNSKAARGSSRSGVGENWWLLTRSPVVTGRDLRDAQAQQSEEGLGWETSFVLTQDAASRFGRFTEANINNRLAIVVDNVVLSAPRIDAKISDQGRITGSANHEEAADLALNLRAGSLPAGVKVMEERIVGPSLGADSIRRGVTAGLVGLALVITSMLLYYRGAGWNAVLALLLNTAITIAALSYIDATWTLPGIAGLVLSMGMAVDSNVLIFERIKEELRSGKALSVAVAAGFGRAFVTILDTHVTTVVASAFLFLFGTGPIRGFAVTLVIGLVANLFTAVFVSRSLFDLQLCRRPRLERLSIWPRHPDRDLFRPMNIRFLDKRRLTLGLSIGMIVISLASLVWKGGPKYGLDFRGGTLIYVRFLPPPPIDELREALSTKLSGEVTAQETKGTGEFIVGTQLADEHTLERARQLVEQTLRAKYANIGGKLDLNNATQRELEERLRSAALATGGLMSDLQLQELAARVLRYRDHERSGLIQGLNELRNVEGIDERVLNTIKAECGIGSFNIRSVEIVGPRAGAQLRKQALLATAGALGGMLVYIAFRFRLICGVAAVIATIHDVVITLGLFSLTDREINLNVIAALLTLIGYSMNDKIVVFDRVRENQQSRTERDSSFVDLVSRAINQTLSRTLLTAGPTLLACLALYFLGGEVLNGIAFALLIGIVVGTYSSIFVASALLVMWHDYSAKRRRPGGHLGHPVSTELSQPRPLA
jgi:preprotein translocase subunit SecD